MWKSSLILVFILFMHFRIIQAQGIQVGIRAEENMLISNTGNSTSLVADKPAGVQLTLGMLTSEKFIIEARAGAEFNLQYYSGVEGGLFGKYYVTSPTYIIAGVVLHNISSGGSISFSTYSTNLILPSIGIGYNISRPVSFELLFQNTFDRKVGTSFDRFLGYYNGVLQRADSDVKLQWIIKLGVGFNWSL